MTIDVRASFAAIAYTCPQSVQGDPGEIRVVTGELPALGQALHYMMSLSIGHGQNMEAAYAAAMYRCDEEELERLAQFTRQCWEKIRQWFLEPMCELYLEKTFGPLTLSGHVDVLGLSPAHRQLRFCDWKTSWLEGDHDQQMMAYATLLLVTYPNYDEAWGTVIRPRQGISDARVYTRAETEAWLQGLVERVTGQDGHTYHAGEHCWRCPRNVHCQAHADLLKQSTQVIVLENGHAGLARGPRAWYERIRLVERACAVARETLKTEVAARGGQWEGLVLTEEERETIRGTKEAIGVVALNAHQDDWPKIVKVGKTELKKSIMDQAPRGQKGKAAEAVLEKLRECGAVEKTFFTKLEIRKRHADEPASISASHEPAAIPAPRDGDKVSD